MRKRKSLQFGYLLAFLFLIPLLSVHGQFQQGGILEPVKWAFSSNKISDTEAELIFTATIENKWHLYSQDIPMSPPATVFSFEEDGSFELIGEVEEVSEPIEEFDPNFEMELKYFAHEAVFKQKVKLGKGPVTIKGFVEYMCCDDTRCLPPTEEDFLFKFNQDQPAKSGILQPVVWEKSAEKLSGNIYELRFVANIDGGYHLYTQEKLENGPLPTEFIFEENKNFKLIDKPVPQKDPITEYDDVFEMEIGYYENEIAFVQKVEITSKKAFDIAGEIAYMVCNETGCVALYEDFSFAFKDGMPALAEDTELGGADEDITGRDKKTLWGFFILSFVFGLIAILTPCVFPMIPMTVSFFMKDPGEKAKGRSQAVVYGLSIIIIYVLVGTILAIFLGPGFANWLSTHWIPNILFFLIFVIFAASFFGMFELTIPSWMINKSDKQADRGGFIGAIFMAVTLVLVSFSCTGPIVGMILVESAGGLVLKPIVGMLGFSLAFALPFTLFAFFPQWLSNLPKSGGWLNSVKVVLGFIELALGLKFLSVADQVYHWGILDREVYIAFWIVIFTLMGLYLLGKIKFAHDSDVKFVSVPRLVLAILTFTFVVYLIPGMFGAPLKALSGYLPPQSTHDFDLNRVVRENVQLYSGGGESIAGGENLKETCEDPKYSDFLHLPHGLEGYFDYEQGLRCAKQLNKPIFIDFTGHGCVNCREMEANVWSEPAVLKRLRDDYVIIALYVDDKTKLPEDDWVKSTYDEKWKKSIGKKYADFQISRFGVNAQPYYVLLDHQGEMLVQPRAYDLDVDEFVDFLDRGVAEFEKRQ